jgi:predicted transcriptional regulator
MAADPAFKQIFPDRVLRRPGILEATRLCGLTDAEIAALLDISPPAVAQWVSGKRPIPGDKHWALISFVRALVGEALWDGDDDGDIVTGMPETAYSLRAKLLRDSILACANIALEECSERHPLPYCSSSDDVDWAALAMLQKLVDWVEKGKR